MSIISNTCSIILKETKKMRNKRNGMLIHETQDKMICNELILKERQKVVENYSSFDSLSE